MFRRMVLSSPHRWGVWSPVGRAHLPVCLHKLEGLHQAQCLVHTAPHGQVVDAQVLDDPVWVNDEKTSAMEHEFREGKSCSKAKHKELDARFQWLTPVNCNSQVTGISWEHLVSCLLAKWSTARVPCNYKVCIETIQSRQIKQRENSMFYLYFKIESWHPAHIFLSNL